MGSTIISLQSSGLNLYKIDKIIPFIPTDLPEPVVPEISKCGIKERSAIIGVPPISFPRLKGMPFVCFSKLSESNISRK